MYASIAQSDPDDKWTEDTVKKALRMGKKVIIVD